MDMWRYFGITHIDHVVCNPMSVERLAELVDLLDLEPGATVWEAACGKGELLVRLAERYGVHGTGIDLSPWEVPAARERAASRVPTADLRFIEGDAAAHPATTKSVDLAVCLGASWIWGGHRGTLRELRRITRPGGHVLVGEPYWIREPDRAYLVASEMTADLFSTLQGNVEIAAEEGLSLVYAMPSRSEDWDRYEFLQLRAAERHAVEHPADPDLPDLLERVRRERAAYLRWGRDTLGWSIYLFRRPG
jgi:SAM-dependent methyltransferase